MSIAETVIEKVKALPETDQQSVLDFIVQLSEARARRETVRDGHKSERFADFFRPLVFEWSEAEYKAIKAIESIREELHAHR